MEAFLRCIAGPYRGQTFPVDEKGFVIGRDPQDASIVLDSPHVSRAHIRVWRAADGKIMLKDLDSTNGTFLLSPSNSRMRLTEGQVLEKDQRFFVGEGDAYVFEAAYSGLHEEPLTIENDLAAFSPVQARQQPASDARNQSAVPQPAIADFASIPEQKLAGRGTRLLAALIDGVVLILCMIITFPLLGVGIGLSVLSFFLYLVPIIGPLLGLAAGAMTLLAWLASFFVYVLINSYWLYTCGQTLGKKLLGIYIAGPQAQKAPFLNVVLLRMFLMEILYCLPWVGGLILLVDICFIGRHDRRMLHDMIAGTTVLNGHHPN